MFICWFWTFGLNQDANRLQVVLIQYWIYFLIYEDAEEEKLSDVLQRSGIWIVGFRVKQMGDLYRIGEQIRIRG